MPNILAYVVLFSWPIVVLILFKRLPLNAAIAWSIIGGYLLLPARTGLDLPLIPAIDKTAIPALTALLMCFILANSQSQQAMQRRLAAADARRGIDADGSGTPVPRSKRHLPPRGKREPVVVVAALLLGLMLVSPIITVLQNGEPLFGGLRSLPGLQLYDAFSMIGELAIMIIPFLLARRFFDTEESHVLLLKILALASLGYTLFAIYELRMGPFLNLNIYGFAQHAFLQHVRDGGFRPMIFLPHGLWVAVFTAMSVIAAAVLWRVRRAQGKPASLWLLAALYLFAILIWGKSAGAFYVTVLLLPCVLLFGVRLQLIVATGFAAIILFYPIVRGTGLVPVNQIYAYVESVSVQRAQSLQVRLENEEALLAKANQKPLAGWGGWGRNRVMDELTGEDRSVTDGMWIIVIGTYGWLGYIAQFGLVCIPIALLLTRARHVSLATSGLCLLLTVNIIDLIPNATLTPVTWIVAGALMGRYIAIRSSAAKQTVSGRVAMAPG
ncbi:MAG: hypothetical protein ACK50Q_15355 [Labrys sp. (in: a-proteobacteria)]